MVSPPRSLPPVIFLGARRPNEEPLGEDDVPGLALERGEKPRQNVERDVPQVELDGPQAQATAEVHGRFLLLIRDHEVLDGAAGPLDQRGEEQALG
jgi:hypothetical protein